MSPSYHERKIQPFISAKQWLLMTRFKSIFIRQYKVKSLIWNSNFLSFFTSFKSFPLLVIPFLPSFILSFSGSNLPVFPSLLILPFSGSNRHSFPTSLILPFPDSLILPFFGSNRHSFPIFINSSFPSFINSYFLRLQSFFLSQLH